MSKVKEQLNSLLAQHRLFLDQAQACITKDLDESDNTQFTELLTRLSIQLTAHQRCLDAGECSAPWGPITSARKSAGKGSQQLVVTGIPLGDGFIIDARDTDSLDDMEAKVQQYDKMSRALARAAGQHSSITALLKDDTLAGAADADEEQARITLLKRYNDIRDVAQQLIGIIAEHKQVSIRSLYRDGSFGVEAED